MADDWMLPGPEPLQLIAPTGERTGRAEAPAPGPERLLEAYRRMVVGRRFDAQATALTKQGRLAVYPSARGQEACQIGAAMALAEQDWLFPTYRDSMALVARGLPAVEVLTLLRGDWHCGYDPVACRSAPQCTPLATQTLHAVGFAHGSARKGRDVVALALIGDGATSEGDFAEALNVAGVFRAPVVFLVQNNGYAISVPLAKQTAAPTLAHRGVGAGVPGVQVDGNDVAAVLAVLGTAFDRARSGGGPTLVEALTYRLEPHTNADDAGRYRTDDEVAAWLGRDPIARVETHLRALGVLDDDRVAAVRAEAEEFAAAVRADLGTDPQVDPLEIFDHVYATPTPQLREQRAQLAAELAATHLVHGETR